MKRGAIWAALAVVLLLAVLFTQRLMMGACDFEQMIITPDGMEFHFTGPRIVPGTVDADWPLEGEGLPPVEHLSQEIYGMPGALFKGTVVKPRTLTITLTTHGLTRKALMDIRAKMQGALRWDRGDPGEPSIYRFTLDGISRDLYVHYDGDVRRSVGRPGLTEVVGIRMIAYDPMWYDPDTEEQVLDWEDSYTMRSIAAKVDGIWSPVGPPSAVGGARAVYSIVKDPITGNIIVGGNFTGWDGLAGVTGNYIVQWNVTTNTWQAIGGGLNASVKKLLVGPDDEIYAGGYFTDGSGGAGDALADYIARYNRATNTWVNVGGGGGTASVEDVVIGHDGTMYLCGFFADWNGIIAADRLVSLPLPYAAGGWAAIGTPDAGTCYAMAIDQAGDLYLGGDFANIGAVAANRIAKRDTSAGTWTAVGVGFNSNPLAFAIGEDGLLYIGGSFIWRGPAGPTPMRHICSWNGADFTELGGGANNNVSSLFIGPDGHLYAAGSFTTIGTLLTPDSLARWNGYAWEPLDIDIPGAGGGTEVDVIDGDLWIGFNSVAGVGLVAGDNSVVNLGNAFSLPTIEIKNAGLLRSIRNETMGYDIPCNVLIQDGEIVTIDLSSGVKSCESTWRGNRLGDIFPASDMATFCLESDPRAAYGGVEGANLITVFITGAAAREHNDGGNQLSGWDNITGISQDNTDLGRLYASIVAGASNRVDFYKDAARAAADLVGHTANYNAAGVQAIIPDNASGLGGMITIDAGGWPGAGDVDIYVYYTIVTLTWPSRWWDLDTAVS